MRIRFKPYARPELADWTRFIDNPTAQRGQWANAFANPGAPLHVELGCGKGGFLVQHALRNPEINYLGIDLKSEVLVIGKRRIEQEFSAMGREPSNIALTAFDIERMQQIFGPGDRISRVYINFCNPWCKSGYAKHRLTHPRQLVQLREYLLPGSEIWFKTDDEALYWDSLRYFPLAGFAVTWQTTNLHRQEPAENVRTEHEEMFSAQGIQIKACIAQRTAAEIDQSAISRLKNI